MVATFAQRKDRPGFLQLIRLRDHLDQLPDDPLPPFAISSNEQRHGTACVQHFVVSATDSLANLWSREVERIASRGGQPIVSSNDT